MKHQEKFRMMLERMRIDEKFNERLMKITHKKEFEELLIEEGITLEPGEIDKYFDGFLKTKEMEKTGEIPEDLSEWIARWNPNHNETIKL